MGIFDRLNKSNTTDAQTAPAANPEKLISLRKEAGISLKKHNLEGVNAAVYLVLDYSGSMRGYYKDHTVQDFTERVLAIGDRMDDDGTVPIVLFDTNAREPHEVQLDDSDGVVDALVKKAGHMGTTDYVQAMQAVIRHYQASGATAPALVIFQTDGNPDNPAATKQLLTEAANLPIFWQFVGFGGRVSFLEQLDTLGGRVIDNAGFTHAGNSPKNMSAGELYDKLLNEYPQWLSAAKAQGIVQA